MQSEQGNEGSKRWIISWEEALKRELEYRRKMKGHAQHQDADFLTKSQEQPLYQNRVVVDRKNPPGSPLHQASEEIDNHLLSTLKFNSQMCQQGFHSKQQLSQQQTSDLNRVAVNGQCPSGSPFAKASAGIDNELLSSSKFNTQMSQQGSHSKQQLSQKQPSGLKSVHGKCPSGSTVAQASARTDSQPLLLPKFCTQLPQQGFHNKQRPLQPKIQKPQYSLQHLPDKQFSIQQSQDQHPSSRLYDQRPSPKVNHVDPSEPHREYRCDICKVTSLSFRNHKQHREGKRHKDNIQAMHGRKKIPSSEGVLWCEECDIPCMNQNNLNQHRLGKKHLARIGMLAIEYKSQPMEESSKLVIGSKKLRTSNWPNWM